jgi:molybdopterin-binding protein
MMRNVLRGEVSQKTDNNVLFHIGNIEFTVAGYREAASYACIRPDDLMISLYGQPTKYANNLSGTITKIVDSGLALQVTVDVPPEFVCLVNRRDLSEMKLVERKLVIISFKPESVHIF